MEFEIIGGGSVENMLIPASVKRAISFLETLDDGQLVTSDRLASEIHILHSTLKQYSMAPALQSYKIVMVSGGKKNYYGNQTTVKEFKKKYG